MPLSRAARPRLTARAVLLERSGGDLQIGLGAEALVLADPTGAWRRLLPRCLGSATIGRLVDGTELAADGRTEAVLTRLADQQLIEFDDDRVRPERVRQRRARLIGAGRIGASLAALLPEVGFQVVYVIDPNPPEVALYPHTTARSQAAALQASLGRSGFRVTGHWSKPAGVDIALTVVAANTLEPDRLQTDELTRADQPHLIVRPLPTGIVVGPLVVPGQTACLRCCDLRRRDVDPDWPVLLRQLNRTSADTDPLLLTWGAAVAATQIAGWLAGHPVETTAGTLELSSADHRQLWRPWSPHPECGCQW